MYKVESKSYEVIFTEFGGAELGNDGSVERYLESRKEEGYLLLAIDHAHGDPRFIFAKLVDELGEPADDFPNAEELEAMGPGAAVTDDTVPEKTLTLPEPTEIGEWVEKVLPKGGADENDRKAPPDGGPE